MVLCAEYEDRDQTRQMSLRWPQVSVLFSHFSTFDSVSCRQMSWLDCINLHADMGFHCSHSTGAIFLYCSAIKPFIPADQNRYLPKPYRSQAVASGSTLFAILFLILDWNPYNLHQWTCPNSRIHFKSPLQKLRSERVKQYRVVLEFLDLKILTQLWQSTVWFGPAIVAQLNALLTSDQEVVGLTTAGLAKLFSRDWSLNLFYSHSLPSADSRGAVVSSWRKNVHNTG